MTSTRPSVAHAAINYISKGWALVSIPIGQKGPRVSGWNDPLNAITSQKEASTLSGNVGLLHGYSSPKTVAMDFDNLELARGFLARKGVELDGLLQAENAVWIVSGRPNRAKLLYKLPDDWNYRKSHKYICPKTKETVFEIRCESGNGKSMQDVLPPSVHPETNQPYQWGGKGNWQELPLLPNSLGNVWREFSSAAPKAEGDVTIDAFEGSVSSTVTITPREVQDLRAALFFLRSDERELRVKVGMSLKNLGDTGRGLFLEWLSTWDDFDLPRVAEKWNGFEPDSIGHKYVFSEAQRRGWVNPASTFNTLQSTVAPLANCPEKLPPALLAVPPLDLGGIPSVLSDSGSDIAERLQCPPDYIIAGMICAVGAIIGNRMGVCPYARDESWVVYPALWGGIVGSPGSKKSPAINASFEPTRALEAKAAETHQGLYAKFRSELLQYETEVSVSKKNKIARLTLTEPVEPKPERLIVNDTTYQKLGEILQYNPSGLMILSDEVAGLIQSLDTQGQEAARGFYLTGWGGVGSYTFDRIGRGTVFLPRYCISIFGGFQPDKIRQYVRMTNHGSTQNDGLLQRFQVLVWPDPLKEIKLIDRPPDQLAIDDFRETIFRLRDLDFSTSRGVKLRADGTPVVHFCPEAQELFNRWYLELEGRLSSDELDSARQSHFAKYRSLVPALALIFHLADRAIGEIGFGCLEKAIDYSAYLEGHANRIYSSASGNDYSAMHQLASKLISGNLPTGFTVRTLTQKGWSGLSSPEVIKHALDGLVEHGWLSEIEARAGGRPSVKYLINDQIGRHLISK